MCVCVCVCVRVGATDSYHVMVKNPIVVNVVTEPRHQVQAVEMIEQRRADTHLITLAALTTWWQADVSTCAKSRLM